MCCRITGERKVLATVWASKATPAERGTPYLHVAVPVPVLTLEDLKGIRKKVSTHAGESHTPRLAPLNHGHAMVTYNG